MFLALANELEPVGPAVLLVEPGLAVGEAASHAALALGRVGAVEERNVLVANVAEPREGNVSKGYPSDSSSHRGA